MFTISPIKVPVQLSFCNTFCFLKKRSYSGLIEKAVLKGDAFGLLSSSLNLGYDANIMYISFEDSEAMMGDIGKAASSRNPMKISSKDR
ncbi:hypothetical protein D918_02146 [Trichuris suis]|nr:hypothetical protein D918_02146 [Trichuris suis]